jgi:Ribbon-helix-helix protein, copG family
MQGKAKKFGPRLTVSLTGGDYDALHLLAEKDEVSVSWVVRRAIESYLAARRDEIEPSLPLRLLQSRERKAEQRGRNERGR